MTTLKRHAEVIAHRVERIARMGNMELHVVTYPRYEYVKAAHARVSVRREVEVTVRPERREHLVARRIDRLSKVLYTHRHAAHYM